MNSIIKKPSAWLPIAIPLVFLVIMLVRFGMFGPPAPEADEGTLAHLFQIWLVLQVFMVVFFAVKHLPHEPKPALLILAMQIIAALAVCFPVFYFRL